MSEAIVNDTQKNKGNRKNRTGIVVSDKMNKTIVVELENRKQHALYGKIMRNNPRVKVHDEDETAGIGDRVLIQECRPLSKDKHHRLVEIVEKASNTYTFSTDSPRNLKMTYMINHVGHFLSREFFPIMGHAGRTRKN